MRALRASRHKGFLGIVLLQGWLFLYAKPVFSQSRDSDHEKIISYLEVFNIEDNTRQKIWTDTAHFEAPNWSKDGTSILFNQQGVMYTLPLANKKPERLNIPGSRYCNNDHGLSPDNAYFAISCNGVTDNGAQSQIYLYPMAGGEPVLITRKTPSYWHGWSPDGNTLAYCANRNGNFDVYTISVTSKTTTPTSNEVRLTDTPGLDDGPDYSADGKYIYFNSFRTGHMKIWRMDASGKHPVQITFGTGSDWFPHPSPDGRWIVFLTFLKEQGQDHPANKDVKISILEVETGKIRTLVTLFGGQGTINVPSWAPDSKRFAFVSYAAYF